MHSELQNVGKKKHNLIMSRLWRQAGKRSLGISKLAFDAVFGTVNC